MYGNENDGVNDAALIRVPVRYGDASRNAQTIIQDNSRNSLPSTPLMTFYIASLDYDRPRIQEPYFVNKINGVILTTSCVAVCFVAINFLITPLTVNKKQI